MALRRNTFPKKEHLCGKLLVDALYEKGEAFFVYPFRVVYRNVSQSEGDVAILCMAGVSKRKLKKAWYKAKMKQPFLSVIITGEWLFVERKEKELC